MDIRDDDMDLEEDKTMKVSLPKRLHLKLHSLKILTGTTVSEMVEEAVVAYFEEHAEEEQGGEKAVGQELGEEVVDESDTSST
jgi:metal-responsive CopG/Arc/MetJ family transcriptional regulator